MGILVPSVTIDLTQEKKPYPDHGNAQLLARFKREDKNHVDHAAYALGMTQAEFARIVLLRAALQVREAAGHFKTEKKDEEAPMRSGLGLGET